MDRWTSTEEVTWFLDLYTSGKLDLNPTYQRKSIWSPKDRRYFLDTIFRNYPCPAIFVHKDTEEDGKTKYRVVDGKQRLETIIKFYEGEINVDKEFGDAGFDGKKFTELAKESKRQFWDYKFQVEHMAVTDNIKEIFDRLNSVSKNLKRQELRHAQFDGWFIMESEYEAENAFWEYVKISTKARAKRMQDVQFISELLMILIENQISTFDQDHITRIYADYDDISNVENKFDKEEYLNKKESVKQYISKMLENQMDIVKWTKALTHFYTLWSMIALYESQLPEPSILASRYKDFMTKVDQCIDTPLSSDRPAYDKFIVAYSISAHGASSDHRPRKDRLELLRSALLGYESNRND